MVVVSFSTALVAAASRDKIAALRAAGSVDVTAVFPERWAGRPAEPDPAGVPSPWLRRTPARWTGRNHLHWYPRIGRVLDALHPDLVHVDEEPYSLVTAQVLRLCARRGLPVVFFAWQNLSKRLPPPFHAVRRYVFGGAAGAIAGSESAAAVLRERGYRGPLALIPQFGVSLERFRPDPALRREHRRRLGINHAAFLVGFAGRLVREKGVDLLLAAAAGVPALAVLLLGDGPLRPALAQTAQRLGLDSRLYALGQLSSTDVPGWLNACDALVLPSCATPGWREQFGRVLIEAMACGVPVVGSRSGEIPAVIGEAGLLVPEGDAAALQEALQRLVADPELARSLASAGRCRVAQRFTQERIAEATIAFYRRLLHGGDGS